MTRIFMKKNGIYAILSAVCLAAFAALIVILKTADVGIWLGEKIGLFTLNKAVFDGLGGKLDEFWYALTKYLGYVAIAVAAFFVGFGIYLAIKRKNLKSVDRDIYFLGACYIVLAIAYVVFEKAIVNYRPVLLDGSSSPEASFPSSHTMLSVAVFGTAIVEILLRIKNRALKISLASVSGALCVVAAVGRLLSCAHWFTDVLGGILLALSIVFAFAYFAGCGKKEEQPE